MRESGGLCACADPVCLQIALSGTGDDECGAEDYDLA